MAETLRGSEPPRQQTDRGALHIALHTGDLSGETQARVDLQAQGFVQQARAVDEGVAMQAAEARPATTPGTPSTAVDVTASLTTPDGKLDAFFVHPAKGKHPAVILWPDIAGLREAYKVMARRLAADGHAVLVLNQYYRSAPAPHFNAITEWRTPEGQARARAHLAALGIDKLVVVGLLRGSFVFIADLVREIHLPVEVDFLEASSYGDAMHSSREVKILKDLRGEIAGRDVLVVEVRLDGDAELRPHVLLAPHLGATGHGNRATVHPICRLRRSGHSSHSGAA